MTTGESVQPMFFSITDESDEIFDIQKDRLYFVRPPENELMISSEFNYIDGRTYELTGPLSTFQNKTFLSLEDIYQLLDSVPQFVPQFVPQMEGGNSDSDGEGSEYGE